MKRCHVSLEQPSDSKNYCVFEVDDFSKLMHTTNLQGFPLIRLPVTVSNRLNAWQLSMIVHRRQKDLVEFDVCSEMQSDCSNYSGFVVGGFSGMLRAFDCRHFAYLRL